MADQMKPTPRSPILGLFSDIVNLPLQYMSEPQRTQQMQGVAQFLYDTGIPKTLERASYGEPLFSGAGMTLRPKEETINAAMNVAPFAPAMGRVAGRAIRATEGLPVGMSIKDVSYRGSHLAPSSEFGAPLHDLTGGGQMYPADIYSSKAVQYYGAGEPYDQKAMSIAQQYRNKPNALVTIYRAVPKEKSNSEKLAEIEKQMAAYMRRGTLPKDAENYSSGSQWYDHAYEMREKLRQMPDEMSQGINDINAGDWVTLTREYAKNHGESALRGQYKILSKKVKAKELWTNADSIHEFGYQPEATASPPPFSYPQQAALDLAQQRAALPVEQGGLGLPPNNTAMDRAKAMGFDTDFAHGSPQSNITRFEPSKTGEMGSGIYATNYFPEADIYAGKEIGATTYPLKVKTNTAYQAGEENPYMKLIVSDDEQLQKALQRMGKESIIKTQQPPPDWLKALGTMDMPIREHFVSMNPDLFRSRFAAFDPFRKDVATATAMGVALPDLLAQPVNQYRPTYEPIPTYTDPFGNTIDFSIR